MVSHRDFDIIVVGATGTVGKLVTAALAGHQAVYRSLKLPNAGSPLPVKYALMGRSEMSLQDLAKECECATTVVLLPVADPANDTAAVNALVSRGTVVLNCLADEAEEARSTLVRECAKTGTHFLDLLGTWDAESGGQSALTKELGTSARATKAVLLGWCGYVAVPPELCILAGHNALKSSLKSATVYSLGNDGTPVEAVPTDKAKHTLAGDILCGRSVYGPYNERSVVQAAKLLGWGSNFTYKEWSPTPVCIKVMGPKGKEDPKYRAACKWDTFVVCEAEDGRTVTVSMKGGAECMWEETARFLVETAYMLVKKPDECPGIRTGGVLTPTAAIGMALVDHCAQVGLPRVTIESEGDVVALLRGRLDRYRTSQPASKL